MSIGLGRTEGDETRQLGSDQNLIIIRIVICRLCAVSLIGLFEWKINA